MKKTVLLLIALFTISIVFSQSPKFEKITSKTDVISTSTITDDMFVVVKDGNSADFPIYKSKSGKQFVKGVSKKGNNYPIWIYTKTEYTYEGNIVYVTKNKKYCVYTLTKSGFPYPIWLKTIK